MSASGLDNKQGLKLAHGSGSSTVVNHCQVCSNTKLKSIFFLGYLPPVNKMVKIGTQPYEQPSYPAELLYCDRCHLVQLGLIVDPTILFPPEYPYTSSTTKNLRDNFAELYQECTSIVGITSKDLVVDIGSNDGNLLSNFAGKHKVMGVTPESIGNVAVERGIPTIIDYFTRSVVARIVKNEGKAKIVTATNVFAHMENIQEVIEAIQELLSDDGVFISESHYLLPLVETLQYDTIYHEHMRYYSLSSLKFLLEQHGLEIFHAKPIPTHGGSVRVYAARKNRYEVRPTVKSILDQESDMILGEEKLLVFKEKVVMSKLELYALLTSIKKGGQRIYGISAPSRASTLINYTGLDDGIIDCVLEIKGSHKIGNYVPGTTIPIVDESILFEDQPEYAMIFSWHIADELIPKLKSKGYKGKFIVPLPEPRIID
ncbi:MAG TPA: methyltransferase [Cytophagales bacterium]|nr:methyltransferase [Cytophagales bacterium]